MTLFYRELWFTTGTTRKKLGYLSKFSCNRVELLESTSLKTHRVQPAMLVQAGNLSYTDNMPCSAVVIHKKQASNFGKEQVAVEKTLNITKILVE